MAVAEEQRAVATGAAASNLQLFLFLRHKSHSAKLKPTVGFTAKHDLFLQFGELEGGTYGCSWNKVLQITPEVWRMVRKITRRSSLTKTRTRKKRPSR